MPDDLVTIAVLHDAARAEMYRDILEQESIEAMIPGAQHRSMLGMVGSYIEIPLKVQAQDAERATEIIDAIESESDEFDDDEKYANPVRPKLKRIAFAIAFAIPGGGHFYVRRWWLGAFFLFAQLGGVFALGISGEELLTFLWIPGILLSDAFGAVSRVSEANGVAPSHGPGRWLARGLPVILVFVILLVLGITERTPAWAVGTHGRAACTRVRDCAKRSHDRCELRVARRLRRGQTDREWVRLCARCTKRFPCGLIYEECVHSCSRGGVFIGAPPAYHGYP